MHNQVQHTSCLRSEDACKGGHSNASSASKVHSDAHPANSVQPHQEGPVVLVLAPAEFKVD